MRSACYVWWGKKAGKIMLIFYNYPYSTHDGCVSYLIHEKFGGKPPFFIMEDLYNHELIGAYQVHYIAMTGTGTAS